MTVRSEHQDMLLDWQYQASNGDTKLSYKAWLRQQFEIMGWRNPKNETPDYLESVRAMVIGPWGVEERICYLSDEDEEWIVGEGDAAFEGDYEPKRVVAWLPL